MQRPGMMFLLLFALGALLWGVAIWPTPKVQTSAPSDSDEEPVPTPQPIAAPKPSEQPLPKPTLAQPKVVEAPPAAPTPPPSAAPEPEQTPALPASRTQQGPVAEYSEQFQHEPRDSSAIYAEQQIREAFQPADGAAAVLRDVLCRQSICRVEILMTKESLSTYATGIKRITPNFDRSLAYSREGPMVDGQQTVAVYVKRLTGAPAAQ